MLRGSLEEKYANLCSTRGYSGIIISMKTVKKYITSLLVRLVRLIRGLSLHTYLEMPTVIIGSTSKSDSACPFRSPSNVAMLLQLSGNGGKRDSGA